MPPWALVVLLLFALSPFVVRDFRRRARHRRASDEDAKSNQDPAAARKLRSLSTPPPRSSSPPVDDIPKISHEEDDAEQETRLGPIAAPRAPTTTIVYDESAEAEEPTASKPIILVVGSAETDRGLRRKRNEDRVLVMEERALFAVADGMGGVLGGELASTLAVDTLRGAFDTGTFSGAPHDDIPKHASELVRAIEQANIAIFSRANQDKGLSGMGTTLSALRFLPKKQRLYIGHVGDSRVYRSRAGVLSQLTSDHTMGALGVEGDSAGYLSRAVGVAPNVAIDLVLAKPIIGDVYLVCSDGVSKALPEDEIAVQLAADRPLAATAHALVNAANEAGGLDNASAVVIRVDPPRARLEQSA